ncbi:hypothetical protein OG921_26375 [Aldersonia sp. NBC_00410]|uniref:hypothetical protein n=1 Tax=Aldersonia sp. NBC_00410 TaxID=2975954 RepID=UPI002256BBB1|nr:hypothetical protein [Aldersonia sp. NBC_00410]MCX5046706.1 hypothetical protein [Aldersonia sp. NBC_00410]
MALVIATGAVWVVDSIYVLWKRRRWTWWMLAWPVATALGVALAFLVQPKFDDARPEFEKAAQQLLNKPEPATVNDFEIGRFEIGTAYSTQQGDVFFSDKRTSVFSTQSGWVYSPDGAPARPTRDGTFSADHIDGPWYRYTLITTY